MVMPRSIDKLGMTKPTVGGFNARVLPGFSLKQIRALNACPFPCQISNSTENNEELKKEDGILPSFKIGSGAWI